MRLLDGKAAIVTGSARGIGRATAELLAANGARVLINDLDEDLAGQTATEIEGETLALRRRPDEGRRLRGSSYNMRSKRSERSTSSSTTRATRGTGWRTR